MNQESKSRRSFHPVIALSLLLLAGASGGAVGEPGPAPAMECPPCDDGNACTVDSCDTTTGTCVYAALACDDQNPCTSDGCDVATGCVFTPLPEGTACDDGNACTAGDACDVDGHCAGTPEPSGTDCDDRNSCTFPDACDGAGACVGVPQSPGSSCDDGLACTMNDVCVQNPTGGVACQGFPVLCDDGDVCTEDACDPATGQCVTLPVDCDDGNACTTDTCDPASGACSHEPAAGASCDDGDACTTGDVCGSLGTCAGAPVDCNDGNLCTDDSCDPATGACTHANNTVPCDDANACTTGDSCADGVCGGGAPVTCGGSSECFADVCDPSRGCVLQPRVGEPCNGGNRCFSGTCTANGCESQISLCDDHDRCTNDSCADPLTGECGHAPVACDDGNACTEDRCDAGTGQCLHVPGPGTACDDGNVCTTSDTCGDGFCGGAVPLDCDDGKDCTLDSCHPVTGCRHAFDARLPDTDGDGIPDSCDNCPAAVNHRQDDCNGNGVGDACDPSLYDLRIQTTSPLGKGSGVVLWSTVCETDLRGFNVVMIDNQGHRVRLNTVPIPCSECITGLSGSYSTPVPKHKSGRNVFLEVLYRTSALLTVGPAVKE